MYVTVIDEKLCLESDSYVAAFSNAVWLEGPKFETSKRELNCQKH